MISTAASPILIRAAVPHDAAMLATLAATTFSDTFAADNTANDMAHYISQSFGESIQRSEIHDSRHVILLAERNGDAMGYAMLRHGPSPDGIGNDDSIEIARLYAVKRMIGAGVGALLMQRCLDEATALGKSCVWLGVWEHNARAKLFYKRWGFREAGTQRFTLGLDRQTDHVMWRSVNQR